MKKLLWVVLLVALAVISPGRAQLMATPVGEAFASLGNRLQIVYGYDPSTPNPWKSYSPSAPPFANQLQEVEPLGGYFVFVDQDVDFTVGPLSKRLRAGWNLVGWPGVAAATPRVLPEFIVAVRGYEGVGQEEFQATTIGDLGVEYLQKGVADFAWNSIELTDDRWKWTPTDQGMNRLAAAGLKVIPFFHTLKTTGLHWDTSIGRDNPRFAAEYEEFAYEVVRRYHTHPAWSGLVAVWGGSSDVWGETPLAEPEVEVPLLNAAYNGIKRADPNTIVISFNMATTFTTAADWEQWQRRAFALSPRFDWLGVQSHGVIPTTLNSGDFRYGGLIGLINVRQFLDEQGYADKPLWVNEGGFVFGEDIGGLPEQTHAEFVAETYIVARTLDVNLKGWVYFEYFGRIHLFEDFDWGLMSSLDQHDPPQPRQGWRALQTLIKTVKFLDYRFDVKLSGEYSQLSPPFIYRFVHRDRPSSKLWVVFSPRIPKLEPIEQDVVINIAPATQAVVIDMLGTQTNVTADSLGNIRIRATSSPTYLKVSGG